MTEAIDKRLAALNEKLRARQGKPEYAENVVAIDAECTEVKLTDAIRALRKTARTTGVPIVVYDAAPRGGTTALTKLGASAIVARGKTDDAVRAIVDLLDTNEMR